MVSYLVAALWFFAPAIVAAAWVYIIGPVYYRMAFAFYDMTQRVHDRNRHR